MPAQTAKPYTEAHDRWRSAATYRAARRPAMIAKAKAARRQARRIAIETREPPPKPKAWTRVSPRRDDTHSSRSVGQVANDLVSVVVSATTGRAA